MFGVEEITDNLPIYCPDSHLVRDERKGDGFPPLRVLLSRERYWSEDLHMDVVVRLSSRGIEPRDSVRFRVLDKEGVELSSGNICPLPGPNFIFYPGIPKKLINGGAGVIELKWISAGNVIDSWRGVFRVKSYPKAVPESGRIPVRIRNEEVVREDAVPFTVGVPFPRGALYDISNLRLLSVSGGEREIPMQVKELTRWSKYGSVKWAQIDFAADLTGGRKEFELEYGPRVSRVRRVDIPVEERSGFPLINAGRMKFDDGLWYDVSGDGNYVKVLKEAALSGAFVVREDGRRYVLPSDDRYKVEESGPEKVVLRREGWYREEDGKEEFCKYITRYLIYRDSPLVTIYHTWIFTGDGNRERIGNMGWEFGLEEGLQGEGLLESYYGGSWLDARSLLQWDYEHFDLMCEDGMREYTGGRSSGAARASGNGVRLYFGARDFWQNYPSELEFADGSLWFHNWPRKNRPGGYTFAGELITATGEPALPSAARHLSYDGGRLTRSEWTLNVIQARFAHEGKVLNFRLPDALSESPIIDELRREIYWRRGEPESANAQGISRTEEMWLYLAPAVDGRKGENLLRGLNDRTVGAMADPAWMAKSGAFHEIHHRDMENYNEDERVYDLIARYPRNVIERLGIYGMWIYGDIAAYPERLESREPNLYRAFRKGHQGWPYPWIPYARSGEPEYFRLADAATRQMIDANWCHYYTEEIDAQTVAYRRIGWWERATLPWVSRTGPTTRSYASQSDYLWHSYYLTGYHRARDIALEWGEQTKIEENLLYRGPMEIRLSNRYTLTPQTSYIDMYEATFDPWFLVAFHALAEGHLEFFKQRSGPFSGPDWSVVNSVSHFWKSGDRDFHRFTGSQAYMEYYLEHIKTWATHLARGAWVNTSPQIKSLVYGWQITGEEYYLRRAAAFLDRTRFAVIDAGEAEYSIGDVPSSGMTRYHGWYMREFPLALAAFEDAGYRPEPVYNAFIQRPDRVIRTRDGIRHALPPVLVRKEKDKPLPLYIAGDLSWSRPGEQIRNYRVYNPGEEEILAGSWRFGDQHNIEIPAGASAGTYKIQVDGGARIGGLRIPVTPVGTHEVVAWEPGEMASTWATGWAPQYWFFVPKGVDNFYLDVKSDSKRVSIWDPEGGLAWDIQGGTISSRAEIEVQPGYAGRMWRITMPGGGRFTLDPQIPAALAVNPERWFMPEWRDKNIFEFRVIETQKLAGWFSTDGGEITVDWGDGTRDTFSGPRQRYVKSYGKPLNTEVKVYAKNESVMTEFRMDERDANIACDLKDLPSGLARFYAYGENTVSGDIKDLPGGLTHFYALGRNTVSGDIKDLPGGLTHFYAQGRNTVSGDIKDLPSRLARFYAQGRNAVSGDIKDLPSGLTHFYAQGRNTISSYSPGRSWAKNMRLIVLSPAQGHGLSTQEVDNLLIDLAETTWQERGGIISLIGGNEPRSSASDNAVAALEEKGVSVRTY